MQSFHASGRVAILVRKPEIVLNFFSCWKGAFGEESQKKLFGFASSSPESSLLLHVADLLKVEAKLLQTSFIHNQTVGNVRDWKLLCDRSY